MKRFFYLSLIVLTVFLFLQCSKTNPVNPGGGGGGLSTEADSIASYWFQSLSDKLATIDDLDKEGIKNIDFTRIHNGFNEALDIDKNNAIANLGLAILEILELNYNESIWDVVDSLYSWGEGLNAKTDYSKVKRHPIIGHQFSLLAEAPIALAVRNMLNFPPNVTVGNLQQIIENTIIPALNRSINYLGIVEKNTDAQVSFNIKDEGVDEPVIIDLGEIYFFDASIHAVRAAFKIAISYDYEFFGPDNTYNWIDDLRNGGNNYPNNDTTFTDCPKYDITYEGEDRNLNLYYRYGYNDARTDSILIAVLYHNLEERQGFLTLRNNGSTMESAHQDILEMINKLEASVYFIRHIRKNETEDNVIKLTDLTELDSNIPGNDPPNFASQFKTVEDVLEWAKSFVTETVEFTERLGPNQTPFTWKTNISVLLNGSIHDLKYLLPYYRWDLPSGNWIEQEEAYTYCWDNYGYSYWEYVWDNGQCMFKTFYDIDMVCYHSYRYGCSLENMIQLLDNNGFVIDLESEKFPYFRDYTFGGLFPEMRRDDWVYLINILE